MEKDTENKYVKKQTMLLVAFIALVAGFVGGVTVGVFKSGSDSSTPTSEPPRHTAQMPHQQMPRQTHGLSPEHLAKMISGLEKDVSDNPDNVQAWTQLGVSYSFMKQYDKAINAYKKSLELKPDNAKTWTNLGVLLSRNGQGTEAIEAFDKAVEIDPLHEEAIFNKGVAFMANFKDRESGLRVWQELVKMNPSARAPNGQLVKELVENFTKEHSQQKHPDMPRSSNEKSPGE